MSGNGYGNFESCEEGSLSSHWVVLILVVLLAMHNHLSELAVVEVPILDGGAVKQFVHLLVGPTVAHCSH